MAEEFSKSKQKRLAVQEEERKRKQKEKLNRIMICAAAAVIVILIAAGIISSAVKKANTISPSTDYGRFLNEDGTLKDVDVDKLLPGFTASDIKVDEAAITATDAYLDGQHLSLVNSNQYADDDPSLTVADGDTINLDYVGTVDGVEFDGGSTGGAGTTLTIGSGTYVDDFEEQLIGTHPGDKVTVRVTFPDDYSSEDLQGKDAEFAVTVNGIMKTPDWNDDFVAEHYSSIASTTAEYDDYLRENYRTSQLSAAVSDYVENKVTLTEYPKKYLRYLESLVMGQDQSTYEQIRQMYASYGMAFPYNSLDEYNAYYYPDGYEAHLEEDAKAWMNRNVVCEKLYRDNGLSVSEDEYSEFLATNGISEDSAAYYGKGYLMQAIISNKVQDIMTEGCDIGNYPSESGTGEGSAE